MLARMRSDEGSAVAESLLVGVLLTALALGVLQLALALHIRSTLIDAAAEGAQTAALADNDLAAGVLRTQQLITEAVGPDYAHHVTAAPGEFAGHPTVTVSVRSPLPVLGLFGLPEAVQVEGHAVREVLGD